MKNTNSSHRLTKCSKKQAYTSKIEPPDELSNSDKSFFPLSKDNLPERSSSSNSDCSQELVKKHKKRKRKKHKSKHTDSPDSNKGEEDGKKHHCRHHRSNNTEYNDFEKGNEVEYKNLVNRREKQGHESLVKIKEEPVEHDYHGDKHLQSSSSKLIRRRERARSRSKSPNQNVRSRPQHQDTEESDVRSNLSRRNESRHSKSAQDREARPREGIRNRDRPRESSEQNRRDHGSRDKRRNVPGASVNSRRPVKQEPANEAEFEWGIQLNAPNDHTQVPAGEKDKPNFGLSGKLAVDTNTYNGILIKYSEPPEARKPRRRWRFYPFKGDQGLPTLYIHRQSSYLIGRERKVADIPIDHPSCSKQHAALQYRMVPFQREDGTTGKRVRPYIIDLGSANGTFINNVQVEPRKYVELLERDVVKFGYSSREYVLLHEHSKEDSDDDDVQTGINDIQND